ncbi:thioredoxin [Necator americanus]|nr:thioredoxin [Necator americanus]ETN68731.1 thioredoxin [Necator americanus]
MEEDTADPVSEQTVIAWLEKFEKGDLVPFLKSQLLPVDWNKEPLKILVGSNYAEVVSDVSKHVFVLLYIPENRRNDYAVEQFAKLAELFLDFDDVVIAKIDMNSNDIPHQYLRVGRLPAARFYPKGEKKELEYSNRPVLADVKDFVEKHTGYVTKFDETAASQSQETEREQSHGEL